MMKNGIAIIVEIIMKERTLKKYFIDPEPKEVPAKILPSQTLPTPIIDNPARPRVRIPINAAFLFCLYIRYLLS